jgi:hypothetical protein
MDCPHLNTHVVREPDASYHHARRVCDECGASLGYLARPSNLNRRADNAKKLKHLSQNPNLSQWEQGFLRALFLSVTGDSKLKLTPRQQASFEAICSKYLGH